MPVLQANNNTETRNSLNSTTWGLAIVNPGRDTHGTCDPRVAVTALLGRLRGQTMVGTSSFSRLGRVAGYDAVRMALAALLLTAAGLKGYELATEPVAGTGLLTSRWFLIGVVEFEFFFGVWLLVGVCPTGTWRAAMLCFGGFAGVALYKALSGEATCGCFGRVEISPWHTLIVDLGAVVALWHVRPVGPNDFGSGLPRTLPVRSVAVLAIWLLAAAPLTVAMATYRPTGLDAAGKILNGGEIVLLEPDRWIGRRFPLLDYIDIGDQLADKKWTVVLYHDGCPDCRESISRYRAAADDFREGRGRLAFVEVPPYGPTPWANGSPAEYVLGRLSDVEKWFVHTPLEIALSKGTVAYAGEPRLVRARERSVVGMRADASARMHGARSPVTLRLSRVAGPLPAWAMRGRLRVRSRVPGMELAGPGSPLHRAEESSQAGRHPREHTRRELHCRLPD